MSDCKTCPLVPLLGAAAVGAAAALILTKACCKNSSSSCNKKDDSSSDESRQIYETMNSTRQYMEFHFTTGKDTYARSKSLTKIEEAFDFPVRLAQLFEQYKPERAGQALDLGCAVGASSFEMTKSFDKVVGIDLSEMFIKYANVMKDTKVFEFEAPEQGYRTIKRTAKLPEGIETDKVLFEVGDAMNVDPKYGRFDGLLAANLLCRVPEPRKLLASFSTLINKGGVLIIASPYSWWEGASPKSVWIGGQEGDEPSETLCKAILSKDFELLSEKDEPFLIRDHTRRYQVGFSHCTVWRRK